MAKYRRIKLKIDGYTPHTLPIVRLAEYLKDLAALLGAESDAHFIAVGEGSAELIHEVPEQSYHAVQTRVMDAAKGNGPPEAIRGYRELRLKLRDDGKPAEMIDDNNEKVVEFPLPEPAPAFGPVTQAGSLEGVLIKIGGRDETVPVHLQDGDQYYKCTATRAMAKELRNQLFEGAIRVHGTGKWIRDEEGEWTLDSFRISGWEPLTDEVIEEVIGRMRLAESGWDKIDDPLEEARRIRRGESKLH
jgi:hypothetical protein